LWHPLYVAFKLDVRFSKTIEKAGVFAPKHKLVVTVE